jgi:choice-of-anchor C domain-containing protein
MISILGNRASRTAVLMVLVALSVVTALASTTGAASASPELVANGSFEAGAFDTGDMNWDLNLPPGDTRIDNWTIGGLNIDWVRNFWDASEGNFSIDLNGSDKGSMSQDLATVAGADYTVSFDLSGNYFGGPAIKTLDVSAGATTEAFSWESPGGLSFPAMDWVSESFTFTATSSTTTLTFASTTGGLYYGPVLDNVSVVQIVPPLPVEKADCKKGGWDTYGGLFKNQGDCVSFVATDGKNPPSGPNS